MSQAIVFDRVSKKFVLTHEQRKSRAPNAWRRLRERGEWKEVFWALQHVSFTIERGEAVGLIGPNGSGKSTILKLLVGILIPTSGHVQTIGRTAALLELGAGFHPDLSGRENIYLNGSILGLSRLQIKRMLDEVVAFAEMERFIDAPVKHYSSGMYMRLGFAIAVHVQPEVLLIDETLAVGDEAFQAKCLARIHEIKKQGVTILLVSHGLDAVRELCRRGIWMDAGRVRADGAAPEVIEAYTTDVLRHERTIEAAAPGVNRWGAGDVEITHVEFCNGAGTVTQEFATGQAFTARIHYHAHRAVPSPVFGVAIYHSDGAQVNGPNTSLVNHPIAQVQGQGVVEYSIPMLPLLSGQYFFSAAVYDQHCVHAYDHHHMRYHFTVLPGGVGERYGLVYIPSQWTHHNGKA